MVSNVTKGACEVRKKLKPTARIQRELRHGLETDDFFKVNVDESCVDGIDPSSDESELLTLETKTLSTDDADPKSQTVTGCDDDIYSLAVVYGPRETATEVENNGKSIKIDTESESSSTEDTAPALFSSEVGSSQLSLRQSETPSDASFEIRVVVTNKTPQISSAGFELDLRSSDTFRKAKQEIARALESQLTLSDIGDTPMDFLRNCVFVRRGVRMFDFATLRTVVMNYEKPRVMLELWTLSDFEEFEGTFATRKNAEDVKDEKAPESSIKHSPETEVISEPDEYFKISLRGPDNEPLTIAVSKSTKIARLEEFYRKEKKLKQDTKVKLAFEDDFLDPESFVGDAELEYGYLIDVHYNI